MEGIGKGCISLSAEKDNQEDREDEENLGEEGLRLAHRIPTLGTVTTDIPDHLGQIHNNWKTK